MGTRAHEVYIPVAAMFLDNLQEVEKNIQSPEWMVYSVYRDKHGKATWALLKFAKADISPDDVEKLVELANAQFSALTDRKA